MNLMSAQSDVTRGVTANAGATKARIERAALSLFAERGVDAVTTREIAAASGVSEGALYRHYPGKEALAGALFFTIHKRLASEIRKASSLSTDIDAQARAIVEAYCRIADEDWPLFCYHLLTTHRFLPHAEEALRTDQDNPVEAVETIIKEAMDRGQLPKSDPVIKASMALGIVLQTALHKAYGRISTPLSAQNTSLSKAVIAVLKA